MRLLMPNLCTTEKSSPMQQFSQVSEGVFGGGVVILHRHRSLFASWLTTIQKAVQDALFFGRPRFRTSQNVSRHRPPSPGLYERRLAARVEAEMWPGFMRSNAELNVYTLPA